MRQLAILLLTGASLFGQNWYNASWQYRKAKVIDHRRVLANLTNFPVFIAIDNDSDLAGHLKASCADFLVTLADGTKLAHEILLCDPSNGTVHAFARVPSLSSTADTALLVYYGNAAASNQSNRTGVWDSNTKMVLNFVGGAVTDSTSNAINATVAGGAPAGTTDSPIGPALSCSGLADRLTTATAPVTGASGMTLSFWFRADMRATGANLIVPMIGAGNTFGFSWDGYSQWAQSLYFNWNGGSNPMWSGYQKLQPTVHRWYFATLSWNGTVATAYTDGGWSGQTNATAIDPFTGGLSICGDATNHTRAKIANVTLSNTGRSAAWIATEYANQAHPELFFRSGAQQTNTSDPAIEQFTATYTTVESGKPTLLQWVVRNATSVSIDNGVGSQTGLVAGSVTVNPTATTTYTLTANSATAMVTITVPTTPVAYLRAGGPGATWIRTFATDGSGHAVIKTFEPHNLASGDYISEVGIATTDAGNTHYHASNLNGKFMVADVVDATSYTIKDLSGAYVAPNDTVLAGTYGMGSGGTHVGRVTPTPLSAGPRGTFDGLNGTYTRKIGTSTNNGLTSLVVSGGVATVTLSYTHDARVGDTVSVWNTTAGGNLNGDHAITAVTANTYQFSTNSSSGNYTNNNACGPSAGDPHVIGGTDNCVVVSLWCNSANPNWTFIKNTTNSWTSAAVYTHVLDGGSMGAYDTSLALFFQTGAIRFWADRKNQRVLDALVYIIQHYERYTAVNFIAQPNDEGDQGNVAHYGERVAMGIANPYTVARTLGHLTASDKATAADKMLNDITDPGHQCTRVDPIVGAGTVTITGNTVIGSGTAFTTAFTVGDAIVGGSRWTAVPPFPGTFYMVTAISDDTHMTVRNGGSGTLSSTPQPYFIAKKWVSGNCSYTHQLEWQSGWFGVQPDQYGGHGGATAGDITWHNFPTQFQNTSTLMFSYLMEVGGALADDDPRAIRLAEQGQIYYWDTNFRTALSLRGFNANGVGYGFGNEVFGQGVADVVMYALAPTLPAPDPQSSYFYNPQLLKLFLPYPDAANGKDQMNVFGASSAGYPTIVEDAGMPMWMEDSGWMFRPTSNPSKWLKSWTTSRSLAPVTSSQVNAFPFMNPFISATDYTTAPLQAKIAPNMYQLNDCIRLTGWNADWGCGAVRGDGLISKTSWTDRSATQVLFLARSGKLGYDRPQPAALSIYAVGTMIYDDAGMPPGNSIINSYNGPLVQPVMDVPTIGTFPNSTLRQYESSTDWLRSKLARWGGGDPVFGDSAGRYAYAMADATEAYSPTYNRIHRHLIHFKKSGTENVVISRWDIDATNFGTPNISVGTFFMQNGENGDIVPNPNGDTVPYKEGTTTCPGEGGCASLDSSRQVFVHGDGAAADAHGPARTTGVITKWFSPGTVTVTWDGSTYPNAQGHASRVTTASTGGTFDVIEVHKITRNYNTDATLTVTAINPDANWTGVQTADKVAMFARGGVLRTSLNFTTSHAGTAQYLIAGLAAGAYNVAVGGTPITGSPFVVSDGDNSLYFESTAGAVTITQGALVCSIITTSLPNGMVGEAYSQQAHGANCTAPVTWLVSAGSLCAGLSLDSASGTISGVPTAVQNCGFTLQATDGLSNSATQPFSISIAPPPVPPAGSASISSGVSQAGTVRR